MTDGIIQQVFKKFQVEYLYAVEQLQQELIEKIKQEFENKNRVVTALPMTTLKEIKENLIGDNQE